MNDLSFDCPHCGQPLEADAALAGTTITCPTCSQGIVLPAAGNSKVGRKRATRAVVASVVFVIVGLAIWIPLAFLITRTTQPRETPSGPATPVKEAGAETWRKEEEARRLAAIQKKRQEEAALARARAATLAAWRSLQSADYNSTTRRQLPGSRQYEQLAYELSQIGLVGVDPLLQKHIGERVEFCRQTARLEKAIEEERAKIAAEKEAIVGFGSLLGAASGDGRNPKLDAMAGAAILSLIDTALSPPEEERLKPYAPCINSANKELTRLRKQESQVASALSRKYDVSFIDAF